ncbi:hypothetical protein [Anatilimnocola floriformis]|uniref:hypothetical protein n=1 Tax=Anatilimnocola floriformis TaxID=2948575 RepID=UPI0020C40A64|nr:hypothetical protein [Anatilimnocola floriformis]
MKRESRGPLILAVAMLCLPPLYLGSYFALVDPAPSGETVRFLPPQNNYRCNQNAALIFWPLEQIDRKLRPDYWFWEEKLSIDFDD